MSTGLDFFVSYAESEGALAETLFEGALLIVPQKMQDELQLSEEVMLTEDPEVAREDGFSLLGAGHPLLISAAQAVLERGDVGCAQLRPPPAPPPSPASLEKLARDQLHAEHGRIDSSGAPNLTELFVLRVGALLVYSISIDERVQEIEEVWVNAASGVLLGEDLKDRLASEAAAPELPTTLPRGADLEPAIADAHRALLARAELRAAQLARQSASRLREQLAVVDGYYQRVIASSEERRARASEDRARMLVSGIEATRAEWARRRAEVAEDLTPSFELRPFRLHLLSVPAYDFRAVVRRGPRAYPLSLIYLPLVSGFLPPSCPSCGSPEQLVAGKDRLGCEACLASPARAGATSPSGEAGAAGSSSHPEPAPAARADRCAPASARPSGPGKEPEHEEGSHPTAATTTAGVSTGARSPSPGTRPRGLPTDAMTNRRRTVGRPTTGRVTPKGSKSPEGLSRTGSKLAFSFWGSVLAGGRWRTPGVEGSSSLAALLRLYGTRGPALVVGLRDGEQPESVNSSTDVSSDPDWMVSSGELLTSSGRELPFSLYWKARSHAVGEVEGLPLWLLASLLVRSNETATAIRRRWAELVGPPPAPAAVLEPPAGALFEGSVRRAGLGFAARCMAAWWYVTEETGQVGSPGVPVEANLATAAAVEWTVGKRLGLRLTASAVAELYGCPVEEVRIEGRRLQAVVRGCPDLRW